ncbi:50S ribosomal protein L3 [Methanofollis fontis]|uniref:Large ribosomal subunit protein uL3 n=1 Tax=Methanofollis fontis TaxID=2052832 RepID=A0A483CUY2_9EURY|nr:50S ribosomal protein L3 [Methanofollis fontis]TAJ45271.1 50S ribosomal protein L3 [Methanofollis fontis]
MPNIHRPRRGSLAYSPRKRAKSQVPKYQSWPVHNGEPVLQGIAGYKVGMTHVIMVDDHKSSPTEGREIMVPVTIVEVPALRVAAVRAYASDTYGRHPMTEVWAENLDPLLAGRVTLPKEHDRDATLAAIREGVAEDRVTDIFALVYTMPAATTGVPKKVPELMETRIGGGSIEERLEHALALLGQEFDPLSLVSEGQYIDVTAITKGKGTQGPVKRWGIMVRKRKHSRGGKKRHIGNLGPWNPHHVRWQVPQIGQMGYQQRTEFNKRILRVGTDGAEIVPEGGFLHYGVVRNPYIMIKGSIPGPVKRIVRIRPAIRQGEHAVRAPAVNFVSLESKQG